MSSAPGSNALPCQHGYEMLPCFRPYCSTHGLTTSDQIDSCRKRTGAGCAAKEGTPNVNMRTTPKVKASAPGHELASHGKTYTRRAATRNVSMSAAELAHWTARLIFGPPISFDRFNGHETTSHHRPRNQHGVGDQGHSYRGQE